MESSDGSLGGGVTGGSMPGGGADAAATPKEKLLAAAAATKGGDPEQPLWQGSYSPKAMIGAWIGTVLLTVVLVVVGVFTMALSPLTWPIIACVIVALWGLQFARLMYQRMSIHYTLTTQRFVHESGILTRTTNRIEVIDMDDITCVQGVVERMLDVGTIKITSSDRTHPELVLKGIENVREVSQLIDNARRSERRRRGLHIESI